MNNKILLIDGHSILNRAFYGIPDLTNSEGLHTNAVYGFLNIMFKILEEEKPEYLGVAFDLKAPTFRHELFKEYKGTRKAAPSEFKEQVPVMKEVLEAMRIQLLQKEGFEADDLLGTIGKRSEEKGMEVTILSGDRDLLQLASEKILVRVPKTYRGKTTIEDYHAKEVLERYQVTPHQIIELKALMGDTADNIPGIPGVGEKTATKIIMEYGDIEKAYANVDDIKPNKAKESLREHYDKAQLSKALATIDTKVDIAFAYDKAQIKNLYTDEAFALFQKLEFKNLLGRFDCKNEEVDIDQYMENITELNKAKAYFVQAAKSDKVAYCFMQEANVFGLSLCTSEDKAVFMIADGEITKEFLRDQLAVLLKETKTIIGHKIKEQLSISDYSYREGIFDVEIAAYLLNPLKSSYSYEELGKEFLGIMLPSKEELLGKGKLDLSNSESKEQLIRYGCYLSYVPFMVQSELQKRLQETKMWDLFCNIEMPLVFTLYSMEQVGIKVEGETLACYSKELSVQIEKLETRIYQLAGETFNINSPKQLGVILFEKLSLPGSKKTKTGYSTAADILDKLADEFPIVKDILEYRQLTKLRSTYAEGLQHCIREDGRIHTTFNQTITATGRISSTEPNLQNIPIRMELGRLIRKVFVPEEGYVFLDADYSQIELRVLAHLSGDEKLIQAYNEAQDIHRLTASEVFHTPFDEVTDLQRRNAKAVNFGIVYGISSFGLSQDLSITTKEAAGYIKQYFETYPKIKGYLDSLVEKGKEDGYVTTIFGRRRPIPELRSSNFMQRSFGERIAMNSPIQGAAADIIKIAMIKVHKRLVEEGLKSRLILQVHDELLIETALEELEIVKGILEEEMVGAAKLAVTLEIDMHAGESWYEAK